MPEITARTAQNYMRLAENEGRLRAPNTKQISHLGVREALAILADHRPPAEADPPSNAAEYLLAVWGIFCDQAADYLEHCKQAERLARLGDWEALTAHAGHLGPVRRGCEVAGDYLELAMDELERAVSAGAVPVGNAFKVFSKIAAENTAAENIVAAGGYIFRFVTSAMPSSNFTLFGLGGLAYSNSRSGDADGSPDNSLNH